MVACMPTFENSGPYSRGAWAAGPIRQREHFLAMRQAPARNAAPYARPPPPPPPKPQEAPRPPARSVSLVRKMDAAESMLSLSPMNSPNLESCVGMMSTPELFSLVGGPVHDAQASEIEPLPSPVLSATPTIRHCPSPNSDQSQQDVGDAQYGVLGVGGLASSMMLASGLEPKESMLKRSSSRSMFHRQDTPPMPLAAMDPGSSLHTSPSRGSSMINGGSMPRRPSLSCMDMLSAQSHL